MGTERFRSALRAIVAEDLPATRDLWPAVHKRLETQQPTRRLLPISHPGWAVAALVLTLAFGTAAYAAISSILDRAVEMDPSGSQYLVEHGLVENLNLSQTVGGITATLEWAYADANRIVLAYTIAHPADRENSSIMLTDMSGTVLPTIMGGYGYAADGVMSDVSSYDAGLIGDRPDVLQLSLHLKVSTLDLPEETPMPPVATVDPETGASIVVLEPLEIGEPATVFDIQFSVPFHPGREVAIGQMAEDAGISITLERAVIAPSDTRFDLCFSGLDPAYDWIPIFTLETPEFSLRDSANILSGGRWLDDRCYRQDFGAPLQDQSGGWRLNVTELVGERLGAQQVRQTRMRGPWEFQFGVP